VHGAQQPLPSLLPWLLRVLLLSSVPSALARILPLVRVARIVHSKGRPDHRPPLHDGRAHKRAIGETQRPTKERRGKAH
jgi:hypothetical protein